MKEKKQYFVWNRKRAAAALGVTAAVLILTGFTVWGSGAKQGMLLLCLLSAIAAGVWVLLDVRFGKWLSLLLYLVSPIGALWALEHYTHVLSDLAPMILLLNLLFFYLLYGLCGALFGSVRTGFSAATLVPALFGLVNYFVVSFRGSPVVPWDLLSLGTAISVADNYTFTVSWEAAVSILVFFWLILLASKSTVRWSWKKGRFASLGVYALLLCLYVTEIQKSSVQSFFGMDTTLFTLNVLYRNNGIAAAFLGNLRFLNIEEPEGYSAERVEELMAQYRETSAEEDTEPESTGAEAASAAEPESTGAEAASYPNIIVIMDEAFSDLSVWGEFATSEEVMPFFKSLQKEGIGGELYVSVKGGNTANTEFEFLTGNTMAFLPAGSVPYQQYIHEELPALPGYLRNLGYETLAIHPYNRSGWDRDTVYEQFGFDEFLDKDAFDNPYRMRGYVSDKSAFDKIIEQFELGDGQKFIFEVTMQNHGGYSKESPDFTSYLKLPGAASRTTSVLATEKYLTLMNQTDRALEELITYFEGQEEPVVVLMFGDHQPSDYITNTIQRVIGTPVGTTLEELQTGYRVPFVIWSNCELEPAYYDGISVNYLGGLLLEAAGVPLTGYQKFLQDLQEELPVISGLVCRDAGGTFHSLDDAAAEAQLNDYRMLQYNLLVDKKHRDDSFFGG